MRNVINLQKSYRKDTQISWNPLQPNHTKIQINGSVGKKKNPSQCFLVFWGLGVFFVGGFFFPFFLCWIFLLDKEKGARPF